MSTSPLEKSHLSPPCSLPRDKRPYLDFKVILSINVFKISLLQQARGTYIVHPLRKVSCKNACIYCWLISSFAWWCGQWNKKSNSVPFHIRSNTFIFLLSVFLFLIPQYKLPQLAANHLEIIYSLAKLLLCSITSWDKYRCSDRYRGSKCQLI